MEVIYTKEYIEVFEKFNRLANKVTWVKPTAEEFRELARLSNELSEMLKE